MEVKQGTRERPIEMETSGLVKQMNLSSTAKTTLIEGDSERSIRDVNRKKVHVVLLEYECVLLKGH